MQSDKRCDKSSTGGQVTALQGNRTAGQLHCHSEPFDSAQDKLPEESPDYENLPRRGGSE